MRTFKINYTEITHRDYEVTVKAESESEAKKLVQDLKVYGDPISGFEFKGIIKKSIKVNKD